MQRLAIRLLFPLLVASATPRAGNPYYYAHWCGQEKYALTLLDDRECQKVFPSNASRTMTCDAAADALSEEQLRARGYAREAPLPDVAVDEAVLAARAPATRDVSVCVVLVERATGGDTWYRYLCGEGDAARAAETWSSSKMFAAANAAGRLRDVAARRPGKGVASPMSLRAGAKSAPLADMATVLASYDTTAGYTSNALGGFFNWVGWRERSLRNVEAWLWNGRDRAGQSLGGNYGEPVPADLDVDPVVLRGDGVAGLAAKADPSAAVVPNTLTPLSAVEMMRRIAMCERLGRKELRFPNTTCADARAMLYGPELRPGSALATARARSSSVLFPPSTVFGGLSADTAIYTQVAALDAIDRAGAALDDGAFRIFSKLGAGYSTSRRVGEVLSTAYACLPVRGGDASVRGLELLLSVRASVPHDVALRRADELVGAAVHDIVAAAMRGELDGGGTRGPAKTQHAPTYAPVD